MKFKDKIKQEWNNLPFWVKIVVILFGVIIFLELIYFLSIFIKWFWFGDWFRRFLHIQGY